MPEKFEAHIDKIVLNTEAKLLAVTQQSLDSLVEDAQTPTAKGGRMRVKTGFLRSSGVAELNSIPSGPTEGERDGTYTWDGSSAVGVVLARMKIDDTFIFGWTARYARHREVYDGFLESALQRWQKHVDDAVRSLNGGKN